MDQRLTPEQAALRDRARRLATDVLEPLEAEVDRSGALDDDTHDHVRREVLRAGLAAANIPAEHGGGGLSLLEQVVVQEQLGRLTNGLGTLVWTPPDVLAVATGQQRARYLTPAVRGERRCAIAITEEHAGSDPRAIASVAARAGPVLRLTGTKWFVGEGGGADFLVVLARVDGDGFALLLVDRDAPGVEVADEPAYTVAYPFSDPHVRFDGTPVPAENVLGAVGEGLELTGRWFVDERVRIAARCVGACDRMIEATTAWAGSRTQFGRRLADHQGVAFPIADSVAETLAARTLTYHVAWLAGMGADRKLVHARAASAKLVASETAARVADRAVQIFGGRGVMRANPVERHWRGLRLERIWEGTSEIQRVILSRGLERRGHHALLAIDPLTPPPP